MDDYYKKREIENYRKLNNILSNDLPLFCYDYFTGISNTTSILTRLNYAYDLRVFFDYLLNNCQAFNQLSLKTLTERSLETITVTDIERFLNYVSYYQTDNSLNMNHEKGKARKLATIRSFYKYFFNKGSIDSNIAAKVSMPKIHEKEIIRLEIDEVVKILNAAESGEELSGRQKAFNKRTKLRDVAILTLFLGTGIRISELVGLNLNDINFEVNCFTVTRKGGNKTILYFSDEVSSALKQYYEVRIIMSNNSKKSIIDTNALFLSLQMRRISVRAVQNLVKKYAKIAAPNKNISPHKLRSTYGTNLYRETQDIYIVADVLGHKDVNTTKKHYAAISDSLRRKASKVIKLRDSSLEDE